MSRSSPTIAASIRPDPSEYAPYLDRYISVVPDGNLLELFASETAATVALLEAIGDAASLHRYGPGKRSIRECGLHLADVERVLLYRALRFARADETELPGFEPDRYAVPSAADSRSWRSIVEEFAAVRRSTIAFFQNLPEEAWSRSGIADGSRVSVRALACSILGHDIHHRRILRERYLPGINRVSSELRS